MVVNLQTDPWPVVMIATLVVIGLLAGAWWFTYFWERMWTDSLSSRSVNRRFLRWERGAFRGHLPLGRWGGPGRIAYVHSVMFASRGLILAIALLLVFALVKRLINHAA